MSTTDAAGQTIPPSSASGVALKLEVEVFHDAGGVLDHAGTEGRVPGPDPQGRSYSSLASFEDPDGNRWLLQEIRQRLPGREWGDEG